MDNASRHTGAGIGLQLKSSSGEVIEKAIRLDFPASKNETKYEAILTEIDLAQSVSLENLLIRSDS